MKINKRSIKKTIIHDRWYVFFISLIFFSIIIDVSIDNSEITIVSISNPLKIDPFDGYYKGTIIKNNDIMMNITNEYIPVLNIEVKNTGERSTILKNFYILVYEYEIINKSICIDEINNIEISNNYLHVKIPIDYILHNQTRIYVMPYKINRELNMLLRKGEMQTLSVILDYDCYECKRILLTINFEYEEKIVSSLPLWVSVMKS